MIQLMDRIKTIDEKLDEEDEEAEYGSEEGDEDVVQ